MKINIDAMIDNNRCPGACFCSVATTCYDQIKKEHICYLCWKQYCRENEIEIDYSQISNLS